ERNGVVVGTSGSCVKVGGSVLTCNAWEACHSGALYSAETNAQVTPPPGVIATVPSATVRAAERQVFCNPTAPAVNPGVNDDSPDLVSPGVIPKAPVALFTTTRLTGAGNRLTL